MSANLLLELCTEELPPKALGKLGDAFASAVVAELRAQGVATPDATVTPLAAPRRLGVHVTGVLSATPVRAVSHKLMPVAVGLGPDGAAKPALLKKMAALGADASLVGQLRRAQDGKAEALFLDLEQPAEPLAAVLQRALDKALAELPIPKVMRYQLADGWTTVQFVRPAHRLVALHGAEVVPVSALGLRAGRETFGHRFSANVTRVIVRDADSYAEQLALEGAVLSSFVARRAEIARQLSAAAEQAGAGLRPIDDAALLDEVTGLVEKPHVVCGRFDEAFLSVPPECLILTMKANQKYFPLLDASGKLTDKFLIVANIAPSDPREIIAGNERVVRARLADAKFFFDQDRKQSLEARLPKLASVVYHNKLGSQAERSARVQVIARAIAQQLGDASLVAEAERTAALAKADLLTDMVGEFPELQGIMGGHYARHDGLGDAIAIAIEDHYKPRFAADELPRNLVGIVVALADKIETLVGLFGIGQVPTGDKDPFALRRHTLGIIRMLMERELAIDVDALIGLAVPIVIAGVPDRSGHPSPGFGAAVQDPSARLLDFFYERLTHRLREQGYSPQEVDAVLSLRPRRLADVQKRLAAVRAFSALPEAVELAGSNKRVTNILTKAGAEATGTTVDPAKLEDGPERELFVALQTVGARSDASFERGDFQGSLLTLAGMKAAIDTFFDKVLVNAQDESTRKNRLALLRLLAQTMNRVADLSKLSV